MTFRPISEYVQSRKKYSAYEIWYLWFLNFSNQSSYFFYWYMVAYASECYLNVHHYYFFYSYMVACSSNPFVMTIIFLAFAGRGSNNECNKNNWPTWVCGLLLSMILGMSKLPKFQSWITFLVVNIFSWNFTFKEYKLIF